ncbi:MAG: chlorophyllide a reductase subunit Y [Halieaceae bacterium]|nr:chlorophyllide a reductase subunit Y [Halieaceae bacterium]
MTSDTSDDLIASTTDVEAGCHAGGDTLATAAAEAGKSDVLAQYQRDYPKGPHDQPQSMCPAFGSLRVGLRMRRTATVLSGSACCVYGLTFTSHFYGARRTVGYVPFDSETLVTGKLFEDIRESVHDLADPDNYDAIVVINLCVPTASGVPLELLPKAINGVRVIGIDVPGFGVPTHAEAKDILAAAMLRYARSEIAQGPVARPSSLDIGGDLPAVALLGEIFPVDAITIDRLLRPIGVQAGPVVPTREWRELYSALDASAFAAIHPFYTASVREFRAAGRTGIGSAPVGSEGTRSWLAAIGELLDIDSNLIDRQQQAACSAIDEAIASHRIDARITLSGYEGSELLVGRLLIELGADLRYVGTACPETEWSRSDAEWLRAHGVAVQFRASLEQDKAAIAAFNPDLAIGTTPVVQHAKELAIPALYFTNLISARPLMGAAGPASLTQIINTAIARKDRFAAMDAFFKDIGSGPSTGIWTPDTARAAGLVSGGAH